MPMIGEEGKAIVVPDIAEAIVGYRAWRVNKGDVDESQYPLDALLSQTGSGGYWKSGPNQCECNNGKWKYRDPLGDMRGLPAHRLHPECTCGWYAFKSIEEAVSQYREANVYGEVWLWGQVIEGTKGYRAEWAEVKKLYARSTEQSEPYRRGYGEIYEPVDLWPELHHEEYDCYCDGCGHEHKEICWEGQYVGEEWLARIAEKYGVEVGDSGWDKDWKPEANESKYAGVTVQALTQAIQQHLIPTINQQMYQSSVLQTLMNQGASGMVSTTTNPQAALPTDVLLRRAGLIPPNDNDPARNAGATVGDLWTPDHNVSIRREIDKAFRATEDQLTAKILRYDNWTWTNKNRVGKMTNFGG